MFFFSAHCPCAPQDLTVDVRRIFSAVGFRLLLQIIGVNLYRKAAVGIVSGVMKKAL